MKNSTKAIAGFTLAEMMIVVAIVALLATIALPGFIRARKRSQATRILDDIRVVNLALDQYAIEYTKAAGDRVSWSGIQLYIKNGTVPYFSNGCDLYGNAYTQGAGFTVDGIPKINTATYQLLSDAAPSDFWSPYYP